MSGPADLETPPGARARRLRRARARCAVAPLPPSRPAPIKKVAEWAEDYRQFWDAGYRTLDAYLNHLMTEGKDDDRTK